MPREPPRLGRHRLGRRWRPHVRRGKARRRARRPGSTVARASARSQLAKLGRTVATALRRGGTARRRVYSSRPVVRRVPRGTGDVQRGRSRRLGHAHSAYPSKLRADCPVVALTRARRGRDDADEVSSSGRGLAVDGCHGRRPLFGWVKGERGGAASRACAPRRGPQCTPWSSLQPPRRRAPTCQQGALAPLSPWASLAGSGEGHLHSVSSHGHGGTTALPQKADIGGEWHTDGAVCLQRSCLRSTSSPTHPRACAARLLGRGMATQLPSMCLGRPGCIAAAGTSMAASNLNLAARVLGTCEVPLRACTSGCVHGAFALCAMHRCRCRRPPRT